MWRSRNKNKTNIILQSYPSSKFNVYSCECFVCHKEIVINTGVASVNIYSNEFEKLNSPHDLWPFKKDQHYNEKGYKLIGEILFDNLNL